MNNTWDPILFGNERLVHDAMYCMKDKGGDLKQITNFHSKFKKPKVKMAIKGLVDKGLVLYNRSLQKYVLV